VSLYKSILCLWQHCVYVSILCNHQCVSWNVCVIMYLLCLWQHCDYVSILCNQCISWNVCVIIYLCVLYFEHCVMILVNSVMMCVYVCFYCCMLCLKSCKLGIRSWVAGSDRLWCSFYQSEKCRQPADSLDRKYTKMHQLQGFRTGYWVMGCKFWQYRQCMKCAQTCVLKFWSQ
jgi:hypothetical protein